MRTAPLARERARLIAALAAATVIVVGGTYIILYKAATMVPVTKADAPAVPQPQVVLRDPVVVQPTIQGQAALSGSGSIYRCEQAGQVVFSDQPCAGGSIIDARPAAEGFKTPQYQPAPPMPSEPGQTQHQAETPARLAANTRTAECALIDQSIAAIESAQRAGGSAGQQDRWRNEKRKLQERQYELRC